jgi:hypothetical protein
MGNDSARDPKRTKRADVLDEVEPRLCWGRSSDSRRVGGHDVGGFVKPEARLCEEVHSEQPPTGWRAAALFGALWRPVLLPKNSGVREAARPCLRLLVPRAEKLDALPTQHHVVGGDPYG